MQGFRVKLQVSGGGRGVTDKGQDRNKTGTRNDKNMLGILVEIGPPESFVCQDLTNKRSYDSKTFAMAYPQHIA